RSRDCGSGLSAASPVWNRIAAGEATIEIAAGVESISLVQFNLNLNGFYCPPLQQRMPAVWWTMNQTADFVAKKYGISREAQDAYVVQSQARVAAAAAAGKLPRIHAARARPAPPAPRDRRRVHGRRDVERRLPRA